MLPDRGAEEEKERGLRSAEANVAKADNDQAVKEYDNQNSEDSGEEDEESEDLEESDK
jgi:ribosomal protein S18 acetylase RimI-like enzyme